MLSKILLNTSVRKEDILVASNGDEIKFTEITHKQIYEEAILSIGRDHHSQVKWIQRLNTSISWEEVWNTVHNILSTNETKNTIWQQIHLNFYTQHSYNKWHKKQGICPLCQKLPNDIYHLILDCEFTIKLWENVETILKKLHPVSVSEEEKAFGITQKKKTNGILVRNWLTYLMRKCIEEEEREAYYAGNGANFDKFKRKFNHVVGLEIHIKAFRYKSENKVEFFDKIITHAGVLCEKSDDGEYQIKEVLN